MQKKALIVQGGWEGHEPAQVAAVFADLLKEEGFAVTLADDLEILRDGGLLHSLHLLVPVWTMGQITEDQVRPVVEAVASGVGLAGCHGGMCDAFRECTDWQFMTGGQWVAHPGNDGVSYTVRVKKGSSPIVAGIEDFTVQSEQYYLHVDPAIEVLAVTSFPETGGYHAANGRVDVPVAWTKRWGHGRVFYNSLGHHADIFDHRGALEMMRRGFLWAAEGKDIAIRDGLKAEQFLEKEGA